jgi:hypothetical protein
MLRLVSSGLVASRVVVWTALLIMSSVLISCGGKTSSLQTPIPNIAGSWEFIAYSNNGTVTGIEVALAEGQVLVDGIEQPNGQITASGTQIAFVALDPASLNITAFGGNCLPANTANNIASGSVTALQAPINFTFTENGNLFNVSGTLSGDGTTLLNATYTPQSGNTCSDPGGTITGNVVPKLAGTYAGQICPPASTLCQTSSDFTDNATATVSENSSLTLSLNLALTGTDNTSFTLSGPVTGNAFILQGTFQGQPLVYYGYGEVAYNATQRANSPSIYLVNATNLAQPAYVGTLSLPQP